MSPERYRESQERQRQRIARRVEVKTRKTIAALLAVGMFLGVAGAARANLILNPGFEADFDGDLNPDNWVRTGLDRVKDFDLNITPYEGNFQFQLQNAGGSLTQQVVVGTAGQYDLSMWIANRPDGTHHLGSAASGQVKLQLRDSSNAVVAPDGAVTADYDSPRGTYVQWSRSYDNLPAGTYTVELRSDGPGSGANQGMVDAFSLIAVGPPVPQTHEIGGDNIIGVDTLTGTQSNEVYGGGVAGARFVRVVQNVNDTFQVAELQAFEMGTGINQAEQAAGGVATAKDTGYGGTPNRANDGNTNMSWGGGSIWHSGSKVGTWLQVELAGDTDLGSVGFWGRTDCCQSRQGDFNLIIEDASHAELYNERIVGLGSTAPYHGDIALASLDSADLTATLVDIDTYVFEIGSNDVLTIANPDPSVYHTILDVNNATIQVELLGALTPGEVYKLIDVDEIIGQYDQIILPAGVDGSMLLNDGTVTAAFTAEIPEPTTMCALGLAVAGLGGYVRKRRQS